MSTPEIELYWIEDSRPLETGRTFDFLRDVGPLISKHRSEFRAVYFLDGPAEKGLRDKTGGATLNRFDIEGGDLDGALHLSSFGGHFSVFYILPPCSGLEAALKGIWHMPADKSALGIDVRNQYEALTLLHSAEVNAVIISFGHDGDPLLISRPSACASSAGSKPT